MAFHLDEIESETKADNFYNMFHELILIWIQMENYNKDCTRKSRKKKHIEYEMTLQEQFH